MSADDLIFQENYRQLEAKLKNELTTSMQPVVPRMEKRLMDVLALILRLGSIDGAHHKQHLIDQIARTVCGVPMEARKAKDYKGVPYEYEALGSNDVYEHFVKTAKDGEDGPESYGYEEGTPP